MAILSMNSSGALAPTILLYLKQASIDNEKLRRRVEQLEAASSSKPQLASLNDGAFRALGLRLKILEQLSERQTDSASSIDERVRGLDVWIKEVEVAVKATKYLPPQLTALQAEVKNLHSRLAPLDDEVAEQASVVTALKKETKMLNERTLAQEERASTLSHRMYEAEVAQNDRGRRLQGLETSDKTLRSSFHAAQRTLDKTNASITHIRNEVSSYAGRFEAVDRDRDGLTEKLNQTLDSYEAALESTLRDMAQSNVDLQKGYKDIMDLLEAQADMSEDDDQTESRIEHIYDADSQQRRQRPHDHNEQRRLELQSYQETPGMFDTHQNFDRQLDEQIGSHIPRESYDRENNARTQSNITLESQTLNTQLSQSIFTQNRPRRTPPMFSNNQREQVRPWKIAVDQPQASREVKRPDLSQAYNPTERQVRFGAIQRDRYVVGDGRVLPPVAPKNRLVSSSSVFLSNNPQKTNVAPELTGVGNRGRVEAEIETQTPTPPPRPVMADTSKHQLPAGHVSAGNACKREADIETQTPTPPPPQKKRVRPPKSAISSQESQALQAPNFLFGDDPKKVLEGPRRETRNQAAHRCSTGGVAITHSKAGGNQKRSADNSMGPPGKKRH